MTTQPPHSSNGSHSTGDDGDQDETLAVTRNVVTPSGDEIAVTEVPDDVAREMGELFGDAPRQTTTPPRTDDSSVIVISDPSIPDAQSRGGSVIAIGSDADDVMVINADDMDRVVIVDQDQPDPTFEERRRKRERREKLKKVRWFKWAVVGVVAGIVVIAVLASPLFSIRDVQVEGAVYTSQDALTMAADLLEGDSYFTLDTNGAVGILKDDPWVEDVRVSKYFPNTVVIEVDERVPVVWYVGEDNKARVVDAEGRIITVLEGWPTDYLQVTGVGPSLAAGAVSDVGYRAAAQTVLALPDELRRLVESLELSPGGELSMTLSSGTIVRFGTPTDLQNKLVSVVVLLRRQNPTDIAIIDVSTGEVTVAMR
jgi:cell division protein FtsQ